MPKTPSVFISYRRSDSSAIAGRIYDRLTHAFGKAKVFKDSYNIAHGADFREVIATNVAHCDVVLVIIGPTWLTVTGKDDPTLRRLDDPNDWVRFEIETALNTPNTTVIPVLVQNAHTPDKDALPESLRELAFKNAISVRDDPDFDSDIARLIKELTPDKSDIRRVIAGLGLIAVAVVALYFFNSRPPKPPTQVNSVISTDVPAATPVMELSRTPNIMGLVIGEQVKVHLSNGFSTLDVRSSPSKNSPIIDQLDRNEIVAILDGPVQDNEKSEWIKIRTPEGSDGWVSARLGSTRSLDPITNAPTSEPSAPQNNPPAMPTNAAGLVIGGKAKVELPSTISGLGVRSEADSKGARRGVISANEIVTILDGPKIASDNTKWWKVRSADNVEGWVLDNLEGAPTLIPIAG